PNIRFDYQYRDAGGSKTCNFVVFANPDDLCVEDIRRRIENALQETEFFIVDQVRIPEMFLYTNGSPDAELDHCFHHFDSVEETDNDPSDLHRRSINSFLGEVEFQSKRGWQAFDPQQRFDLRTR